MKKKSSMHIILWLFCVFFFIYQYGVRSSVPSVLNEDLRSYFSITTSEMGKLISLFYLAYTVMQIPVGLIIDRFSAKRISLFAFICVSVGTIAFVATNSYLIASLSQLFLGFGCSFAFVLIMKVTNDFFPQEKVALVSSVAISCGSLGPVTMSPMLAYLSGIFYWKSIVLAFGFLGFAFSIIGFFAVNEKLLPLSATCRVCEHTGKHVKEYFSIPDSVKAIISNSQYLWIGIFSMMTLGPVSAFCDAWGLSFIKHVYGVDRVQAAAAVSMVYLGTIFGGPFTAYLSEKFKSYKKVMIYGGFSMLLLFGIVVFVKLNFYFLYVVLFVLGISATCQFLAFPAALCLAPKKIGATLTGVVNTITMLGGTLLVFFVGEAIDFSKGAEAMNYSARDYQNGMTLLLISIVLAIASTYFVKDKYCVDK